MVFPAEMIALPFMTDEHGAIKIKGTRVPVDNIIGGYKRGETPEKIVENFDVLKLSDVYATIAYYLDNKDDLNIYLEKRETEAEQIKQNILSQPHMETMRERFSALKRAESNEDTP